MTSNQFDKLSNPSYRKAFVASQVNIGIPFQLRALMKGRGWTQEQLAERTGMLQPRISAMLKPGKVRPNIETLRRFAEAFDCGLLVRFAPYSELVRWSEEFNPEGFAVPSFDQDADLELLIEEPQPASMSAQMSSGIAGIHLVKNNIVTRDSGLRHRGARQSHSARGRHGRKRKGPATEELRIVASPEQGIAAGIASISAPA